jgi:glycosyltransferase involved in cell wall biosynthesis
MAAVSGLALDPAGTAGRRGSEINVSIGMKSIVVCICTYRRPALLKRLLEGLMSQNTDSLFTYSIVVADNDHLRSGEAVVSLFAGAPVPTRYCVEPRRNIALARNKAVMNADGDFIAFIDDDEFPTNDWLLTLFKTCMAYRVDGVLGPVKPVFDKDAPAWVIKGGFYLRATYPTGFVIDGKAGRTGNVLLKKEVFAGSDFPFRPEFRAGEDQDFFTRMIAGGRVFIWCEEAVAYETVPSTRWKRSVMLKRALLRGATTRLQSHCGPLSIAKSIVAVPLYGLALPFAICLGHHRFMVLLVKLCDHLGKLLVLVGVNPIKEPYVTG